MDLIVGVNYVKSILLGIGLLKIQRENQLKGKNVIGEIQNYREKILRDGELKILSILKITRKYMLKNTRLGMLIIDGFVVYVRCTTSLLKTMEVCYQYKMDFVQYV